MVSFDKIKTIIRKEWAEVFKNRLVLFTIIFLPLLFTALPLIIIYSTRGTGTAGMESVPPQLAAVCGKNLTGGECLQYSIISEMMVLFMLMPLIIPVNIAAYSIVGEKTTRSLEPLLATPITTLELVIGKNLASVIPAVVATIAGFILYAIGAFLMLYPKTGVFSALMSPMWLLAVFLLGPLLALLSVNVSIMVSSRVNDPRAAEQISAVVIIPVMVFFFAQIAGLFALNQALVLLSSLLILAIDAIVFYLAIRLFQRENILTRWK